ncbi:uncharacterized protein TNCV_2133901 [Trichonephila clavipes]|nr:uncharacterized protein TNCV_2133901 [Trichonephila clavipes]
MYIHWCAKIKDEVEKLAYQLNEEAERTERPIRRLSKVMYGSTMRRYAGRRAGGVRAVKITPSCCLSEKWRTINLQRPHLDAFTRGRICWEVGGRPQWLTVWPAGIPGCLTASLQPRLWRQFQTTGAAIPRGSVVVVHEETTPADDRCVVLQTGQKETGGKRREKSLGTRCHRRLDDRYRVLPWPEDCTVVVCLHRRACYGVYLLTPAHRREAFSRGAGNTGDWRDNEWGRVLLTDERRFSFSSDSQSPHLKRGESTTTTSRTSLKGTGIEVSGVLVWGRHHAWYSYGPSHLLTQVQSTGPVIVTRFFFHSVPSFRRRRGSCRKFAFHGRQCRHVITSGTVAGTRTALRE